MPSAIRAWMLGSLTSFGAALCFNWRAAKASDRQVWGLPLSQLHHLQLKTKLRFVFFCGFTNVVVGLCESVKAWGLSQQEESTFLVLGNRNYP